MSDERPDQNSVDELEERAIMEAFEALERHDPSVSNRARPYLELLATMPAQLDPAMPSAATKEALMAAVGSPVGAPERGESTPAKPAPAKKGLPGWALRIAAVLALALLGISALEYSKLSSQSERIEQQAAEIERLRSELAQILPARSGPPEWMAASGTELCALTPRTAAISERGEDADSKGWLFVRQDHQHWYVAVEGLSPAPEDHVYELWFVVEGELVSGGTFRPDQEGRASLNSETMPNPVTGIAITLEPDNGDTQPSETMVLYGDEVMLVL